MTRSKYNINFRKFAENILQVKFDDLLGEAPSDLSYENHYYGGSNKIEWTEEELDRKMQSVFNQMHYFGFKPTIDLNEMDADLGEIRCLRTKINNE